MFPRVSIIILNWNGWRDTVECLESVYRIDYPNYDVIVVDNASQDASIEKIKEYAQGKLKVKSKFFDYNPENKPIKIFELSEEEALQGKFNRPLYDKYDPDRRLIIIKNRDNYGFTGGNNVGMKFATSMLEPKYIMLLNNDTVVARDFLNILTERAEHHTNIGILSPKVVKYHNPRIIDSAGHVLGGVRIVDRGKGTLDEGQFDKEEEVMGAIAAAALYNTEMILQIGLFDETFGTNYEDAEYSWRANKFGWPGLYVPDAVVYHKRGATTNRHTNIWLRISKNYWRNSTVTVFRYGTLINKIRLIIWTIIVSDGSFLKYLLRINPTPPMNIYWGLHDAMKRLRSNYRRVKYL